MDKYEYKQKTDEMLELMEKGSYREAAAAADEIDWKKVRNAVMLTNVSDIYEQNKEYGKSYDVLKLAYHRAEGSRKIISKLCTLAVKTGNLDAALEYYDDFMQTAPKDPNQYILKYHILRAQKAPVEQQIEALEEYKKSEYIEEWAYELARLYQEAGMTAECLEECDDLILWFSEGKYVYKAMELKMQYKPLTPSQQEKYDKRFEKFSEETEEMPDIAAYMGQDEEQETEEDNAGGNGLPEQDGNTGEEAESTEESAEKEAAPDAGSVGGEVQDDAGTGSAGGNVQAAADNTEEAESQETPGTADTGSAIPNGVKKRKIGNTMPLDVALRQLLHPEKTEEPENPDEEPPLDDLEQAIDEIESVADADMVKQLAEKKKAKRAASSAGEMTEIIPDDDDQTDEQMNPEEIIEAADAEEIDAGEELLEEDAAEVLEDTTEFSDDIEETEQTMSEAEGESEGDIMEDQKSKKTEPILPPDIQRMIDEIEGVIPPQEEEEKAPVKRTLPRKEEPRENMGKVADSLRIDDDDDLDDEDYLDSEEAFADDFEEDYFDEEAEELPEEDYFDEETEGLSAEDYFDEEAEEDYFDEEAEGLPEEEDYFDEEEYFDEDPEDLLDKDDLFGEPVDGAIGFEEEFRINPAHDTEADDREIPDDDDDNMDILSSTKPLSRKETAKMIATGKTAPLPLDEISDALSMTDTGFIVHGRYDLEMQSGIGTRAGLTDEQKKLFSYFVPVRGMSEQLVDVLEQDKNCTNRQGTSRTGNLLIVGNKGNGKTVLAVDVVKAIQKQRNIRQGKVAIVTGDSLNKKRIGDIFDKLYGGALIIEKAGRMNEKTVARLNKAMEKDTGELLIVLEEQRKPIDRLLSSNREFRRKFTSRLEVPIFINDELVTFGQTYAQENGYRVDEMGILALYSKIDSLQREDHAVTVAEVKEIMDEAIQHSQKASAKKLVKRVFGKNTDDSDRILLSEKDFNI